MSLEANQMSDKNEQYMPSPFEGLNVDEILQYTTLRNLKREITSRAERLEKGELQRQFVAFKGLKAKDLKSLERQLDSRSLGINTRLFSYEQDETISVVMKLMPGPSHEIATWQFFLLLRDELFLMNPTLKDDLCIIGTADYPGRSSKKQGDCVMKPRSTRPGVNKWPTFVIECGVSESLNRLRVDASWWLANSNGEVKIVLLISMKTIQKTMIFETWELGPATNDRPVTRSVPAGALAPTQTQAVTVVSGVLPDEPLVLGFKKIFLRDSIAPECDILLSPQALAKMTDLIWADLVEVD